MTETISYLNEHLWPGYLGHLCIVLSFVSALFGSISFFRRDKNASLNKLSSGFLGLHVVSTFGSIALLFYIVLSKFYEYNYAYKVANDELPFKYIFSGFWQDQEGSFLLWMFWHCVLLIILFFNKSRFRNGVIGSILAVEAMLASMLLGIYIPAFETSIGVNPFALLREVIDIPLFANADYVSLIKGQGLNPLLQNYWNVIHPPTLFLGFASSIIPFAFAISALRQGEHITWLKSALPWTLWAAAILGIGILMGSAWAYEALSFGGYWAWDPVENSSLVPWILQVACIHSMLVSIKTKRNVASSYIMAILSFVFIIYSTFLTRSGVLGDTSVHAFTEMGLEWQLIMMIVICLFYPLILFFRRRKDMPKHEKEERISSREFWMFIGVLVLIFSGVLIIFTTSIPVYNKIVDAIASLFSQDWSSMHRTAPLDPVSHYNKYQIWIACIIAMLSSVSLFLRYKEWDFTKHKKRILIHLIPIVLLSLGLTLLLVIGSGFTKVAEWCLMFSGLFMILVNLEYFLIYIKSRKLAWGTMLSHFGFGLMLVGILYSGVKKRFISNRAFLQKELLTSMDEEEKARNVFLFQGSPLIIENYQVEYVSDSLDGHNRYFQLEFKELNKDLVAVDSFSINPHIIYSRNFDKVEASNPYSKHYIDKDLFCYLASIPSIDQTTQRLEEDTLSYVPYRMAIGDTINLKEGIVVLESIHMDPKKSNIKTFVGDVLFEAKFNFLSNTSKKWQSVYPSIILRGNTMSSFPDRMNKLWAKIKWDDGIWEDMLRLEDSSEYQSIILKPGEFIEYKGLNIRLNKMEKLTESEKVKLQASDIALGAELIVSDKNKTDTTQAHYVIRGNRPMQLKEYMPDFGLSLKFESINPNTGQAKFGLTKHSRAFKYPFMVAENAARKDFLVLQVREFPWIILFWIGTICMMSGLFISTVQRTRERRRQSES